MKCIKTFNVVEIFNDVLKGNCEMYKKKVLNPRSCKKIALKNCTTIIPHHHLRPLLQCTCHFLKSYTIVIGYYHSMPANLIELDFFMTSSPPINQISDFFNA